MYSKQLVNLCIQHSNGEGHDNAVARQLGMTDAYLSYVMAGTNDLAS